MFEEEKKKAVKVRSWMPPMIDKTLFINPGVPLQKGKCTHCISSSLSSLLQYNRIKDYSHENDIKNVKTNKNNQQ